MKNDFLLELKDLHVSIGEKEILKNSYHIDFIKNSTCKKGWQNAKESTLPSIFFMIASHSDATSDIASKKFF